jgi:hypothetical protein
VSRSIRRSRIPGRLDVVRQEGEGSNSARAAPEQPSSTVTAPHDRSPRIAQNYAINDRMLIFGELFVQNTLRRSSSWGVTDAIG